MLDPVETKKPWESTGVWGGATAILAAVVGLGGYSLSADDAALLPVLLTSFFAAGGGILAIFGRVRASKRIG